MTGERDTAAGYVCGVDLGTTYAAFCLIPAHLTEPPGFAIFKTVRTIKGTGPEGHRDLADAAREVLWDYRELVHHARFERPMGRHVRSVANLSSVKGALSTAWLWYRDTTLDEISPGEWKQLCGLSYHCQANTYRLWAEHKLRPLELVEHEAAAYGVACSIILDSAKVASA